MRTWGEHVGMIVVNFKVKSGTNYPRRAPDYDKIKMIDELLERIKLVTDYRGTPDLHGWWIDIFME